MEVIKKVDPARFSISISRELSMSTVEHRAGPPRVAEGLTVGIAEMTRDPPHNGELHPDGDELLYLVEGTVDVVLDIEDGERRFSLKPREAFVVPRGTWHRVVVKEPCRLLYFTPGHNRVRWKHPEKD